VTETERLRTKHRGNGLLIDSNLFVLLLVGTTNESRIAKFNRTRKYTIDDFRLLRDFADNFQEIVTTPHVLAEVSNLATLEEPELRILRANFQDVVERTRECYEPSQGILSDPAISKLGMTDAAIRRAAAQPLLVLTDDLPLYHYLCAAGLDAINFNHIRDL
jgi:hypothetical protein